MSIRSGLPVAARCRVIVDNDWTGDPDGLVALAHHLLSPGNRVVAVTSSMINPIFDPPSTAAADGAALARELRRCTYSVAELEHDLGASGRLGAWLWERFTSLPLPDFVELGELWPLGDSPPVLVTALGSESSAFTTSPPADGRGPRRIYTDVDVRLIVGDLLAKLRLHERRTEGQATR
jgi:hypothetical protein